MDFDKEQLEKEIREETGFHWELQDSFISLRWKTILQLPEGDVVIYALSPKESPLALRDFEITEGHKVLFSFLQENAKIKRIFENIVHDHETTLTTNSKLVA